MKNVSVVTCNTYQSEEVYQAIRESLDLIQYELPEKQTVLIKPNIMSQNRPEQNTVTHPAVVEGLCRLLQEKNCRIFIGESIAFYQSGLTRKAYEIAGIKEVADRYGAELVPFEEMPLVKITDGLTWLSELYLPKILFDVDLVIDACKLKSHGSLRLSGAVKNLFGCMPGGYKQKMHLWSDNELELSDVFLDILGIVKPGLSIMDAVIGLDGGPTAMGKGVKLGRILASTDAVALDLAATKMISYKAEDSAILVQAAKRGFVSSLNEVRIIGAMTEIPFKRPVDVVLGAPTSKKSIFVCDTYVNLRIDGKKCIGCGTCEGACPVGAITHKGERYTLNQSTCISCYHCMYTCRQQAIRIVPTFMNQLIWAVRRLLRL